VRQCLDCLVAGEIVLEIKSVELIPRSIMLVSRLHESGAQTGGLLMTSNVAVLKDGLARKIL